MIVHERPSSTASGPRRDRRWPQIRSRLTAGSAHREPSNLLVTALLAMTAVVAAVCVLATTPQTWTLLLAVGAMVSGTLLLIGVIGLQLGRSDSSSPQEHGLVERIEQRVGLPLTTCIVDGHGNTSAAGGPLVLCYDDTHEAARAIQIAGGLFKGRRAIILTVWHPPAAVLLGSDRTGSAADAANFFELDRRVAEYGGRVASDGVRIARRVGFDAEPLAVEAAGSVWKTIVDVANQHDAAAIVLGDRSRANRTARRLGGHTSRSVADHAGRPTLVVREPRTGV